MTAIALWINKEIGGNEEVRIWVTGDSRLTNINARAVLVDQAIKILGLPIICREPSDDSELDEGGYSLAIGMTIMLSVSEDSNKPKSFNKVYFSHYIGMAYAGSNVIGTNLYLTLMATTTNLVGTTKYIPSIMETAEFASEIAAKLCSEMASNILNPVHFEFSLNGFCKNTNSFKLIYIEIISENIDKAKIEIKDFSDEPDDFYLLLGDKKDELSSHIKSIRSKHQEKDINWWRAPFEAISSCVMHSKYETIGGYLQTGIGHKNGFNLIGWQDHIRINFLDLPIGKSIGQCNFIMPGIMI